MPSTYSSNLRTQLMQTGEQAGLWGNNTNFNLGTLMEQAISSYVTQAMTTATTVALTILDAQDGGGNTNATVIYGQNTPGTTAVPVSGRNMYIELTGTGGGGATLQVPTNRKLYFIYNNTTGDVIIKTPSQVTGVTVPVGAKILLVCNGTDVAPAVNYISGTNTSGLFVNSSGNVGIGTSSPAQKLDIGGNNGFTIQASLTSGADANFHLYAVNGSSTNASGQEVARFGVGYNGDVSTSFGSGFSFIRGGSSTDGVLAFLTSANERMRIDASGNVGIGTTTITSQVSGTATVLQLKGASTGLGSFKVTDATETVKAELWSSVTGIAGLSTTTAHPLLFNTSNTERMRIDSTGNLVMNNTTGGYIRPTSGSGDKGIIFPPNPGGGSDDVASIKYYVVSSEQTRLEIKVENDGTGVNEDSIRLNSAAYIDIYTGGTGSNAFRARFSNTGGLSVGTTADPGAGAIYATGNITAYYSDDRLKTRKGNIENALSKVLSLDGFHYEANEAAQALGYKAKPEVGLSAQQVQAVLPEVVVPAPIDEQYLTVHYERLIPLLVEAIKEQNKKIEALEARLNGMR